METIGPQELAALSALGMGIDGAVEVPFGDEELEKHSDTHFLLFAPSKFSDGSPVTIISLRERFGIDPSRSEPCFYNQDWYLKEKFANTPLDDGWHLLRKNVLEDARAKEPDSIEQSLDGELFPTAVTCALAFFAWWFHAGGEKLWNHDFLWCSDRDHNGDRVYVGRYEDPEGVNKNGFNIHRHLSLRPSYSTAPEVIS